MIKKNYLTLNQDLKKSIKTVSKSAGEIHIQSDMKYSKIHNEGGTIRITEKMRKFFWAKYYETRDESWKYMALTKKSVIAIPKRQFMGINNNMIVEMERIILSIIGIIIIAIL